MNKTLTLTDNEARHLKYLLDGITEADTTATCDTVPLNSIYQKLTGRNHQEYSKRVYKWTFTVAERTQLERVANLTIELSAKYPELTLQSVEQLSDKDEFVALTKQEIWSGRLND